MSRQGVPSPHSYVTIHQGPADDLRRRDGTSGPRITPLFRGLTPLRDPLALRTVETMRTFFNSLRRIGFQRGPRRLVAGIGGGLAEKFGIDVWLVRLLLLASFLLPVLGLGAYLVAWALLPWQDGRIPLERVLER